MLCWQPWQQGNNRYIQSTICLPSALRIEANCDVIGFPDADRISCGLRKMVCLLEKNWIFSKKRADCPKAICILWPTQFVPLAAWHSSNGTKRPKSLTQTVENPTFFPSRAEAGRMSNSLTCVPHNNSIDWCVGKLVKGQSKNFFSLEAKSQLARLRTLLVHCFVGCSHFYRFGNTAFNVKSTRYVSGA